ncbi:PTCB-BRCT domain containing protein [Ceratobasidium theobromae]|uniref:PTCB-BRCT domain containing protein n=1 Tax=Ceratobasidium theobromae TaxID=1582974 RepID=A0A5N5QI95_9AGAM|nr:PTCB-BRCT domain containing protein [Ceratobasidium theobromae]
MSRERHPIGKWKYTTTHYDALRRWSGSDRDLCETAAVAIAILKETGVEACVFGSLACKLLGVECKPNDVDLIVLNTGGSLQVHQFLLLAVNPQFYLLPSHDPAATYWVLWYTTTRGSRVKVDILQPGVMSIPAFSSASMSTRYGSGFEVLVAPVEVILLVKLQGWNVHRLSGKPYYNNKQYADVEQIRGLLKHDPADFNFTYLPQHFLQESQESGWEGNARGIGTIRVLAARRTNAVEERELWMSCDTGIKLGATSGRASFRHPRKLRPGNALIPEGLESPKASSSSL